MATIHQTQQPGLRAFVVYDRLPTGCLAYPVTDVTNEPHLRPGDIAIIDPHDREPSAGELFVIDWQSGGSSIVETMPCAGRFGSGPNGEMIDTVCWNVAASNRARSYDDAMGRLQRGQHVGWIDGPYATEGPRAGALSRKLRGRVVGILRAAFAEPLRLSDAGRC